MDIRLDRKRTKLTLQLQDIYSTAYVSNLAEDIIRDAEEELYEKKNPEIY